MNMESGNKNINGIDFYYESRGNGYPLIMIMGLSANTTWWPPPLLDLLADTYRVITFDNRGAGRSSRNKDAFTMETLADDTVALMDTLGIEKAHVLGISMGGMIAQEISLKFPQRVNRLVLCATAPGGAETVLNPDIISEMVQANMLPPEQRGDFTAKILFTEKFAKESPDVVNDYRKRILEYPMEPSYIMRQTEAVVSFSSLHRLHELKIPTLVIGGAGDLLLPPENSRMIAAKIPGAKLLILENEGHAVMASLDKFLPPVLEHLRK